MQDANEEVVDIPVTDTVIELYRCPNCGHSPNNHTSSKEKNYFDTMTKGQDPQILFKRKDPDGQWSWREYGSNETPGGLSGKNGCFKATIEHFKSYTPENPKLSCGYNYYTFCDCPIDKETVLALIQQGKTFIPKKPKIEEQVTSDPELDPETLAMLSKTQAIMDIIAPNRRVEPAGNDATGHLYASACKDLENSKKP